MRTLLTIGMVEIALHLDNLVKPEKADFSSGYYVPGTTIKAKQIKVHPDTHEEISAVQGYVIENSVIGDDEDLEKFLSQEQTGPSEFFIPTAQVKTFLQESMGDTKGSFHNGIFIPTSTLSTFVPSGKFWSVSVLEERTDKRKVAKYLLDRLSESGEAYMGKLTYSHGSGLSEALVALIPTGDGRVVAQGYYFPADLKANESEGWAEVQTAEYSAKEKELLTKLFERQSNDFKNGVVQKLRDLFSRILKGEISPVLEVGVADSGVSLEAMLEAELEKEPVRAVV